MSAQLRVVPEEKPGIEEVWAAIPGTAEIDARRDAEIAALAKKRRQDADAQAIDDYRAAQRQVEKQAERLKVGGYQKLSALLAERTTVEWLLRDQLEAGVSAVIAGPLSSYKSGLVNDWAMRVAVFGKRPVFILSPEGSGLQRRLQGWLDEFAAGTDPASVPLYVRNRRLNLSDAGELDALVDWLAEIEADTFDAPALLIIDTWSKCTGHEENDNTETKLLLGELDRRVRYRSGKPCTIVIVAHTGHKEQQRARGAYALMADTDALYTVSFDGPLFPGLVQMTRGRFKDSPALPSLWFKPKILTLDYKDKEGHAVTSVVLMPAHAPGPTLGEMQQVLLERLCKLLDAGTPATRDAIIPKGPKARDERKCLNNMVDSGKAIAFDGETYSLYKGTRQMSDAEAMEQFES